MTFNILGDIRGDITKFGAVTTNFANIQASVDNTSVISQAINAGFGEIYFPKGKQFTGTISATDIVNNPGLRIIGSGNGGDIGTGSGLICPWTFTGNLINATGCNGVSIENMYLEGAGNKGQTAPTTIPGGTNWWAPSTAYAVGAYVEVNSAGGIQYLGNTNPANAAGDIVYLCMTAHTSNSGTTITPDLSNWTNCSSATHPSGTVYWAPSTSYPVGIFVEVNSFYTQTSSYSPLDIVYMCVTAHTSNSGTTITPDLSNWAVAINVFGYYNYDASFATRNIFYAINGYNVKLIGVTGQYGLYGNFGIGSGPLLPNNNPTSGGTVGVTMNQVTSVNSYGYGIAGGYQFHVTATNIKFVNNSSVDLQVDYGSQFCDYSHGTSRGTGSAATGPGNRATQRNGALLAYQSQDIKFTNWTIYDPNNAAVFFNTSCHRGTARDITWTGAAGGVAVTTSDDFCASGLNGTGGKYGLIIRGTCRDPRIIGNFFQNNTDAGIVLGNPGGTFNEVASPIANGQTGSVINAEVIGNVILGATNHGIRVDTSAGTVNIIGGSIRNCGTAGSPYNGRGIYATGGGTVRVLGTNISDDRSGTARALGYAFYVGSGSQVTASLCSTSGAVTGQLDPTSTGTFLNFNNVGDTTPLDFTQAITAIGPLNITDNTGSGCGFYMADTTAATDTKNILWLRKGGLYSLTTSNDAQNNFSSLKSFTMLSSANVISKTSIMAIATANAITAAALSVVATANVSNGITITGSVAGVAPSIAVTPATGGDTNQGLTISALGTGTVSIPSPLSVTGAVNFLGTNQVTVTGTLSINNGSGAGCNFYMADTTAATDTKNVLWLRKGGLYSLLVENDALTTTSTLKAMTMLSSALTINQISFMALASSGAVNAAALTVTGTSSVNNGITITGATTGNDPSISVTTSSSAPDTNRNLVLSALGTGAITTAFPVTITGATNITGALSVLGTNPLTVTGNFSINNSSGAGAVFYQADTTAATDTKNILWLRKGGLYSLLVENDALTTTSTIKSMTMLSSGLTINQISFMALAASNAITAAAFTVTGTSSVNNGITITGATTGNDPSISVTTSSSTPDTNRNLVLSALGTGAITTAFPVTITGATNITGALSVLGTNPLTVTGTVSINNGSGTGALMLQADTTAATDTKNIAWNKKGGLYSLYVENDALTNNSTLKAMTMLSSALNITQISFMAIGASSAITSAALTVTGPNAVINGITITGTATGSDPSIAVTSSTTASDTNRNLIISALGTGSINTSFPVNITGALSVLGTNPLTVTGTLSINNGSGAGSVMYQADTTAATDTKNIIWNRKGGLYSLYVENDALTNNSTLKAMTMLSSGLTINQISFMALGASSAITAAALTVTGPNAVVNGITITGTATGSDPSIAVTSSTSSPDTNRNLVLSALGTGAITTTFPVNISGALTLTGTNTAAIGGTLTVTGISSLNNNTTVTGIMAVTGATNLTGALTLTGTNTAAIGGTLTVTGISSLNNNTTVTGIMAVTGATNLTGAVSVLGTNPLTVTGTISINNSGGGGAYMLQADLTAATDTKNIAWNKKGGLYSLYVENDALSSSSTLKAMTMLSSGLTINQISFMALGASSAISASSFTVTGPSTVANGINIAGQATGTNPIIALTSGSDANAGMTMTMNGTGVFRLNGPFAINGCFIDPNATANIVTASSLTTGSTQLVSTTKRAYITYTATFTSYAVAMPTVSVPDGFEVQVHFNQAVTTLNVTCTYGTQTFQSSGTTSLAISSVPINKLLTFILVNGAWRYF